MWMQVEQELRHSLCDGRTGVGLGLAAARLLGQPSCENTGRQLEEAGVAILIFVVFLISLTVFKR